MRPRRLVPLAVAACLSMPFVIFAQPQYTVHDVGTLGGSSSQATGVNNSGQVVGGSTTVSSLIRPFRTAANSAINPATDDLGTLCLSFLCKFAINRATGINSSGQVVGVSREDFVTPAGFRTAPNSPINPATDNLLGFGFHNIDNIVPTGINDSGQVAGWIQPCDFLGCEQIEVFAFRTAPNSPMNLATDDLGTLGGAPPYFYTATRASGINSSGQVVGDSYSSYSATGLDKHAFRTAPNSRINPVTDDLGTLGGSFSGATGINSSGQVVGASRTVSGQVHAFRTAANSAINPATDDLGTLGGSFSQAAGINRSGQVVGYSTAASGEQHAFLYSGGVIHDLNNLIATNSGWTIAAANATNDLGQIAGNGIINGVQHAIRLDPTFAGFVSLLQEYIGSLDLPPGIRTDLKSVLQAALNALQRGDSIAARNQFIAFENKVNALRGKTLTDTQADILLNLAAKAIQLLS